MNNFLECKISLQGGIGDCIRVLSSICIPQYYKTYGCIVYVTYGGKERNDCGYTQDLKKYILSRNPAFSWINPEFFDQLNVPDVTINPGKLVENFDHSITPNMLPINLLNSEQRVYDILRNNKFKIGIQFRQKAINGWIDKKIWSVEYYKQLVKDILSYNDSYIIYIIDIPGTIFPDEWKTNNRIVICDSYNISQVIYLIQQMNFFISTDSWMKYIAKWINIPQIILVCYLANIPNMIKGCFRGFDIPNISILGANGDDVFCKNVNEIKPDIVFKEFKRSYQLL